MGAELVNSFAPLEGEEVQQASSSFSYINFFESQLPFFLSIGMSWEQFWDGECEIARHYRKAHELKRRQKNEELWLQGLYIYEALCDVAPVMHAFAGKDAKPITYSSLPYPITEKERIQRQAEEERKRFEAMKEKMYAKVSAINAKMKQKEADANAGSNS